MTDFNTWNEETIRAVQKHLTTQTPIGDHAEFQYIIDALDSLTDGEATHGFPSLSLHQIRRIPEMLREGNYADATIYLGKSYDSKLPQEVGFWRKAYKAVRDSHNV